MAASSLPGFGPAGPGPAPGSVEHGNVVSTLDVGRTITKVWVFIGALVALLEVISIFLTLLTVNFPGGGLGGLIYAVLWIGTDLLILGTMRSWMEALQAGRYTAVKEPLLLWGVLGLLFGVLPGIFLLLAYLHVMPWGDHTTTRPAAGAPTTMSAAAAAQNAAATAVPPPPPYGVGAPPPKA